MNELMSVLPLVIVLVVFYTILWVPQRRRNKKHTQMINDLKIGNNVDIAGGSGVIKDIPDNSKVMGYPAKNIRDFLRENK